MTNVVEPGEGNLPRRVAEETLEWISDFRAGQFNPAYYDKRWPVEMDGLADSAETLARALIEAQDVLKEARESLIDHACKLPLSRRDHGSVLHKIDALLAEPGALLDEARR